MKAVILAAGPGKRIRAVAPDLPKALVPVAGLPLLQRTLASLRDRDFSEIIITTGYQAGKIEDFLSDVPRNDLPPIRTVLNDRYENTNYIYSLWLAREALANEDVLLIHGDMIFDPELLTRLLAHPKSAVLVSQATEPSKKDFNARIENGQVVEIGLHPGGTDIHPCMPLYKWKADDFSVWMKSIHSFISEGNVKCYAEDAFNALDGTVPLDPLWFGDELCMEVDTAEDLALAESRLK